MPTSHKTDTDCIALAVQCHAYGYRLQNDITLEGFSPVSVVAAIGDFVFKLANNARALLQVHKDFTRNELVEYTQSNVFTYKRILRLKYDTVKLTPVTVPTDMAGLYAPSIQSVIHCIDSMDLMKVMNAMSHTVASWEDQLEKGVTDGTMFSFPDTPMQRAARRQTYFNAAKQMKQRFSGTKSGAILFKDVYLSMSDFEQCNTLLLKSNTYFRDVETFLTKMEKMSVQIERILSYVQREKVNVPKKVLAEVSGHIGTIAALLDTYAGAVTYLAALTHHTVLTCQRLENHL